MKKTYVHELKKKHKSGNLHSVSEYNEKQELFKILKISIAT